MSEAAKVLVGDGVEDELLRYVGEEVALDGRGLRVDERLVETGRIDSLGLVQLLSFVATRYGVDLSSSGDPRDLESIAALAAAIRRDGRRGG